MPKWCGRRASVSLISTATAPSSELEADGLLATVIQHEMDHLDGVLFIDHLSSLKRNMILRKLLKSRKVLEEAS